MLPLCIRLTRTVYFVTKTYGSMFRSVVPFVLTTNNHVDLSVKVVRANCRSDYSVKCFSAYYFAGGENSHLSSV